MVCMVRDTVSGMSGATVRVRVGVSGSLRLHITAVVIFFSGHVSHDGVLPCRRYVARACGRWPFSRLSGSRC